MAWAQRLSARRTMLWTVFLPLWAAVTSTFNPSQDSELTFLLPAGASECFFQNTQKNGSLEVEYQVPARDRGENSPLPALSPDQDL